VARALYSGGAVWNTMITVARVRTLFDVFRRQVPGLADVFVRALRLSRAERPAWLAAAYESLTPVDFSRDLMSRTTGLTAYVFPASMGWTDLGTPDRLARWVDGRRADVHARPAQPRGRQPGRAFTTPVCAPAACRVHPEACY
jgi:mannose-1-phosphate guanylyltransferase